MTLEDFLSSTRETADTPLRAAMVSALARLGDPARRPPVPLGIAYSSFYRAVVGEIEHTAGRAPNPGPGAGHGPVCQRSRMLELSSLAVCARAGEDSLQIVPLPAEESPCKERQ